MDEIKNEAGDVEKVAKSLARSKRGEHTGRDNTTKYSGSRKSSIDTTNTNTRSMFRLENTFKLGPDENKRFFAYKLQPNIQELISNKMDAYESNNPSAYNPKAVASLARDLADSIRREAKNMGPPRYKVVVHVVAGENCAQDVRVGSRCLWNMELDNCVSLTNKTKNVWVSAVIYVLYAE
jgi:hypothetical protein